MLVKLAYEMACLAIRFYCRRADYLPGRQQYSAKEELGATLARITCQLVLGIAAVFLYTLLRQVPFPSTEKAFQTPWWGWFGGIFGAVYGLAAIVLASQLGAATLTALVVTGQLLCSVILDHFGWLSFDVHPASWARIAGCALMVVGLILIAKF